MGPKVIVIAGPTAIGKTGLGIELAQQFNGEIISGDSMQVYRELAIGTAKPTKLEQDIVPHHLINTHSVDENYDASQFKKLALQAIDQIWGKGKIPIIVGGSGLYLQGLVEDMTFGFQKHQKGKFDGLSNDELLQKLTLIDPESAKSIHLNQRRRLERALEVSQSNQLFSKQKTDQPSEITSDESPSYLCIALSTERLRLYERINRRVDIMVENGLIEETKWLYAHFQQTNQTEDKTAIKAIGYKELFPYIEGEKSLEECLMVLKQSSRRYAKRQLTWFKNRMPYCHWFDLLDVDKKDKDREKINRLVTDFLRR